MIINQNGLVIFRGLDQTRPCYFGLGQAQTWPYFMFHENLLKTFFFFFFQTTNKQTERYVVFFEIKNIFPFLHKQSYIYNYNNS